MVCKNEINKIQSDAIKGKAELSNNRYIFFETRQPREKDVRNNKLTMDEVGKHPDREYLRINIF